MRQLEKEKEILMQGLEMAEKAREWYHKQIVNVEEKQKYVGRASFNVSPVEEKQKYVGRASYNVSPVEEKQKYVGRDSYNVHVSPVE